MIRKWEISNQKYAHLVRASNGSDELVEDLSVAEIAPIIARLREIDTNISKEGYVKAAGHIELRKLIMELESER